MEALGKLPRIFLGEDRSGCLCQFQTPARVDGRSEGLPNRTVGGCCLAGGASLLFQAFSSVFCISLDGIRCSSGRVGPDDGLRVRATCATRSLRRI